MLAARRLRSSFSKVVTAAVLTVPLFVIAAPLAHADPPACGSDVTADTTLTADVVCPAGWTGDGLRVTVPGVTLDLAGFDVLGPGAAGVRLLASDVTVTNGSASSAVVAGFTVGVVLEGDGGTVRSLTASGNEQGILLAGVDRSVIAGNVVSGNSRDGIIADISNDNTIWGNTVSKNSSGIAINASDRNAIDANTVSKNRLFGLAIYCDADANMLTGNSVVNTSLGAGIIVRTGSDDTVIAGNGANLNAGDGILVEQAGGCPPEANVMPTGTEVLGNSANRNTGDGIDVDADGVIAGNDANLNAGFGIDAPFACDGGGNTTQNNKLGSIVIGPAC